MKRLLAILAMLAAVSVLSGCISSSNTSKGLESANEEGGNLTLDQQGAWAYVNTKKFDAAARIKEAEAEIKQAEADIEKARAAQTPSPQIVINSAAELQEWGNIQRERNYAEMLKSSNDLANNAISALAPAREDDSMKATPQPKHVVAQVVDSTGDAAEKIAKAPAVGYYALAKAVGESAGDHVEANGDGSNINGSLNRQKAGRDIAQGQEAAPEVKKQTQLSAGEGSTQNNTEEKTEATEETTEEGQ